MIIWNIVISLAVIALAWVVWHLWQFMSGIESQDDHKPPKGSIVLEPKDQQKYLDYLHATKDPRKWPCNIEDRVDDK